MNILFFSQYTNSNSKRRNKTFCSKPVTITKEQLEPLVRQGLSIPEICENLGLKSKYICKNILQQFGLTTKSQASRKAGITVSSEKFKELISEGKCRSEIIKELNITLGIYNRIYRKLGLESNNAKQKTFIDNISQNEFLSILNSGKTVAEIRKELNNISRETYDALLKKFNIETIHKQRLNNASGITKEKLKTLLDNGRTSKEMTKELKIAPSTLTRYLKLFNLETDYSQNLKNAENITKEDFLKVFNEIKTVKQRIETLKISGSTYKKLLNKFELTTKFQENRQNTKSITKELLQSLVDSSLTAKEIYTTLNISNKTFYNLLKIHQIAYNYKHHDKEIIIQREKLKELADSGKSIEEITKELGIYASTYNNKAKQAGVNTKLRDSINKIESVSKKEIQDLINIGLNPDKICEKLNITVSMYRHLVEKYNLITPSKQIHKHISQITKKQILDLKNNNRRIKDICKELNISLTTYYKIINE